MRKSKIAAALFIAIPACSAGANAAGEATAGTSAATLEARVQAFDAAFFDAFNRCDISRLERLVAADLEFFHDRNGTMRGRTRFIAAVRENVCGKYTRERSGDAPEVWPLGKDGAIYSGTHRFCQASGGCQGQARFLHILAEQEGQLVLSRVVSYDHRPLDP
ncbi:MAG TPA: nuclear transport factor 2 family protein [Usitatibacteraceae bacterium]|nr:nuclear transport factor 2 family protein [Usitatibacteraceae bacterium]